MANFQQISKLLLVILISKGVPVQNIDLTCFVTPPVRDIHSAKPVELLAVRGGSGTDVVMTFSSLCNGEIYSNGNIVELSEKPCSGTNPPTCQGSFLGGEGSVYSVQTQSATLFEPEDEYLKPARFGVHYCDLFHTDARYRATLLIYNQQTLIPKDGIRTHVFSVDDTLELCVEPNLPKTWKGPIEWAFNGKQPSWLKRFTGSTCITIKHLETCQAGIYEANRRLCGRHEKQHAFFDVRVRSCPDGYHTLPACTSSCKLCVTGYCGDDGNCVCANGFRGALCDIATQNHFSENLEVTYSDVGLDPLGEGSLICTEHAGCSCTPGRKGIDCNSQCDTGTFGPDCAYACSAGICDPFTGL